jgi:hypothetical protein
VRKKVEGVEKVEKVEQEQTTLNPRPVSAARGCAEER